LRFCTETEEDFQETLSLMEWAQFDSAFMFKYSERPGTYAAKHLKDDVPEEVKSERLGTDDRFAKPAFAGKQPARHWQNRSKCW
jgi:tRNA A37 methylthiotransferase MiaB